MNTVNRHINTTRKNQDWSLTLKNKYVIIGDSNVSKMRNFNYVNLQIDSFPGAKFQHAGNLIEKATITVQPEMVIFSFGINNRTQRCVQNTTKEIQRTYKMARNRLPNARLYFRHQLLRTTSVGRKNASGWSKRVHKRNINARRKTSTRQVQSGAGFTPLDHRDRQGHPGTLGAPVKLARSIRQINSTEKFIVNLTASFHLTKSQESLLLKGLSFVPAPRNQKMLKIELLKDLQKYHRRIKLEAFFEKKTK